MLTQGTFAHSVYRAVLAFLSFAIPLAFTAYPDLQTVTVGSVLFAILHYLSSKVEVAAR
jgi:ABC-type uncharacterized transport system permease subunit